MPDPEGAPASGGGFDPNQLKSQLGTPGLIAVGGAAAGVLACLLPWYSVTVLGVSSSVNGLRSWHGGLSLLIELSVAALAVRIAQGKAGTNEKNFCFGVLGGGGVVAALSLLFMLSAGGGSGSPLASAGLSLGVYLNLLAGAGMAYGGFLMSKAKGHLG
ncbi:MAG: hypothetical protein HZA54_09630 [Planctomycetes bacterium]|nr:hypothetical protein [Planctomycetota bacterium]